MITGRGDRVVHHVYSCRPASHLGPVLAGDISREVGRPELRLVLSCGLDAGNCSHLLNAALVG